MRELNHLVENILKAENPIWLTILIVVILLIMTFLLSPRLGAKIVMLVMKGKNSKIRKRLGKKYFLNHPIYDYFAFNQERIKNLDFGGRGKTDAIRDMLFLKFKVYKQTIREFILEGTNLTDRFEFKRLVDRTILKAEEKCEREWKSLSIELLNELIRDYNTWHSQSAAFSRIAVCNITNSDIYDNVPERMQEVLAILETKFRVTMPDIEKGLREANGKYKELEYTSIYF